MNLLNLFKSKATLQKENGKARSKDWKKVRNAFIKNKSCEVCGCKKGLDVHHIQPFWLRPDLELSENNLIVLCETHHLFIGHLNCYRSYNINCVNDARVWKERIKERP